MGFHPMISAAVASQKLKATEDTTLDGKQVWLVAFADSNYDGRGPSDIVCPPDTLFLWKGGQLVEITTQYIANNGNYGTPWKQFAITRKQLTGFKTVIIPLAWGGSKLYPDGIDNYDWYTTTGILRARIAPAVSTCLTALGLTKIKGVLGNACINDVRRGTSLANITDGFNSAVSFVQSTFPGVEFQYCIPGHDENDPNSLLLRQVRDMIVQKAVTTPNFSIAATAAPFWGLGYGTLHWNDQAAYNNIGASNARYSASSTDPYSKYARSIIACHYFSTLTDTDKAAINAQVNAFGARLYDSFEYVYNQDAPDSRDNLLDYTFLTAPTALNVTYTSRSHCATTGNVNSYFLSMYTPSVLPTRCSQTDQFHAIWLKKNYSDATTIRSIMGASNAAAQFTFGHNTSGTFYRCNDNTLTQYATDATVQDETLYLIYRNGTQKGLNKNGTTVATATVASTGNVNQNIIAGGRNNGGANSNPMQIEFRYLFGGKFSTIDPATIYNIFNARKAAIAV